MRTWLLSWNRAVQIQILHEYGHSTIMDPQAVRRALDEIVLKKMPPAAPKVPKLRHIQAPEPPKAGQRQLELVFVHECRSGPSHTPLHRSLECALLCASIVVAVEASVLECYSLT